MLLFSDGPATILPASRNANFERAMSTATLSRPLLEQIHNALTTCPHVPCDGVRFETEEGRVVLHGSVRTFFQKQMAQEVIRRIDGVQRIDNLLQVNWA